MSKCKNKPRLEMTATIKDITKKQRELDRDRFSFEPYGICFRQGRGPKC